MIKVERRVKSPTIPKLHGVAKLIWDYRYAVKEFKTDLGTVAHRNKEIAQEKLFAWLDENIETIPLPENKNEDE